MLSTSMMVMTTLGLNTTMVNQLWWMTAQECIKVVDGKTEHTSSARVLVVIWMKPFLQ
jgi:hypothetical protein